jgi:hypothetical protein
MVCAAVAAALAAAMLVACTQATGPSLTVAIEGRHLEPSSTVPNAAALCCCRVRGNVRNTSSIPIHVEARFFGTVTGGQTLVAVDWVHDLPAGAVRAFDAEGFTVPCFQVTQVKDDPLAFGIYSLPQ